MADPLQPSVVDGEGGGGGGERSSEFAPAENGFHRPGPAGANEGASSLRLRLSSDSTISGATKSATADSDADVAGDITTAPPGLGDDPLDVRGFDPEMEVVGLVEGRPGALGPIWAAKLTDGTPVIVFGLTPRDGFDRQDLREQVTERLRELAVIVHPQLAFPIGMVETDDGVGLVFRGGLPILSHAYAALNAYNFLHRAGLACAVPGGSYFVHDSGLTTEVCCWGLIRSVDALAVNPSDPYTAPELVGDDGRAVPTDATEVFAFAALCAKEWYRFTVPERWSRRNNDHIRPLLKACLSRDPNDRPDLDTALLWMMAEAEHREKGWTAAHMACQRDRADFLQSYLKSGGDVEAETIDDSVTLLGIACLYGSLACVDLLLDRGADPIAGRALHWAACGGQAGLVDRFVNSGIAVQVKVFDYVRDAAAFAVLLDHFDGNLDEVATAYMSNWPRDPACLALLIRRGVEIVVAEGADPWYSEVVEKAHALAAPGAHPLDLHDPQPGGGTVLSASHRHRTHLSDDGRSVVISLSGDGEGGEAGSKVTINLPSWVHIYLSADLVGSEVIGRGAFGTVTRRKLYGTTPVAVKAVNVPSTVDGMQSFVWEVASHVMLSAHPHTVLLMGLVYDEAAGALGLVCELMDQDLAAWLQKSQLVEDRAYVLCTAADGLAYIHSMGLVHRDIKPANIFVSGSFAKIGDFGLTSVVGGREGWTRSYAAPEVLGRDDVSTAASDAYSFGLVVYEVLAEVKGVPSAVEREGKEGAPPWMVKGGLPVPEGWWAMVLRQALSSHPDERPPVTDWVAVLSVIRETETVNCSRFLGLCMTKRWEEAMGCTEGVDTDGINRFDDGCNALHFVAGSRDGAPVAMVATKCIELGCNINAFSTHSFLKGPPLACVGTAEMAAELVAHGADVNAADEDMVTVLMRVARNGREVVVRILLDAGADPVAVDREGRTAVDWAYGAYAGEDVLMLLLEAGAVPGNRERVLKKARGWGHDRVVAWIETAAADDADAESSNGTIL